MTPRRNWPKAVLGAFLFLAILLFLILVIQPQRNPGQRAPEQGLANALAYGEGILTSPGSVDRLARSSAPDGDSGSQQALPAWGLFPAKIVDRESRAAIPGARVYLVRPNSLSILDLSMEWEAEARGKGLVAAISDANGFVKVPMWKSTTHLLVFADEYCPRIFLPKPASSDLAEAEVILEMDRGATIYGVVLQDGVPVNDMEVSVSCAAGLLDSEVLFDEKLISSQVRGEWVAETSPTGKYELGFLPVGTPLECSLEVVDDNQLPRQRSLVLKAGERLELDWILGRGCRLKGLVSDENGNPIAFMQVKAVPVEKRENAARETVWISSERSNRGLFEPTDNNGAYEIRGLWPGTWSVSCLPQETKLDSIPWARAIITIREGQTEAQADLVIHPRRILEGVVGTPAREPVQGAFVICSDSGGGMDSATTDTEGTFHFDVPEAGHYLVMAFPPSSISEKFFRSSWTPEKNRHERIEVILRESGHLVLTIHGGPNKVSWNAHISLFSHDEDFSNEANGSVEHGVVQLEHLLAGPWSIVVRSTEGRVGYLPEVNVRNTSSPVRQDVTLGPAGHLWIVQKRPGASSYVQVLRDGGILWAGLSIYGQPISLDLPAGEVLCASYSNPEFMNTSPVGRKPNVEKHVVLQAGALQEVEFGKQ